MNAVYGPYYGYHKGSESVGYRGHLRYPHLIFARASPDQKTDPQQNSATLVFHTMTLLHPVVLLYSVVLYNDLRFVLNNASPLVAT